MTKNKNCQVPIFVLRKKIQKITNFQVPIFCPEKKSEKKNIKKVPIFNLEKKIQKISKKFSRYTPFYPERTEKTQKPAHGEEKKSLKKKFKKKV